jgi:hypothetical protein
MSTPPLSPPTVGSGEFNFANVGVGSSNLGTQLQWMLMQGDIQPGSDPSYQLCKVIYLYHPLGAKMVEIPITLAQSMPREITIPNAPEDRIKEAFLEEWEHLGCDTHIFNTMRLSRIYGISSLIYGAEGVPTDRPIANRDLHKLNLYFNILDPLNTAGSLVMNQQPNAPDFLKHTSITVSGQPYHRSRSCVILNEEPIYISFTVSAFGFTGRSVYQRALFPLKSYVQSMLTNDLVTYKAGVIIAKIKQFGTVADKVMQGLLAVKRAFIQMAQTANVISIGHEDDIETMNLQNTDTAMTVARKNIIEDIAAAAMMPAILLNNETYAEGFGEGTEDSKAVASYIQGVRGQMKPLYNFFDSIVMYRAWNPEFYQTIQNEFPEYKDIPYIQAFQQWKNSFTATWPSLLIEPESKQVEVEEVKLRAMMSAVQVLLPELDPQNKASTIEWFVDNFNEQKNLYKVELNLDMEELNAFLVEKQKQMEEQQQQMQQQQQEGGGGGFGGGKKPQGGGAEAPKFSKPAVANLRSSK